MNSEYDIKVQHNAHYYKDICCSAKLGYCISERKSQNLISSILQEFLLKGSSFQHPLEED